jgi:hypothetical protein
MFRSKFRILSCSIALAAPLAWVSDASAVCLVSYAGPKTFHDMDDAVVLPNISIGLEGTVSLQFKAHQTVAKQGLWYYADSPDCIPGSTKGEYRINISGGGVWAQLWPCGCSSGFGSYFIVPDMTNWHTVSLSWKNGYDAVLRFDGRESRFPIAYENGTPTHLEEFTSTTGNHLLGASPAHPDPRPFDGEIRDLVIYDTYQAPEPSVLVLTVTAVLGLLAYAWRRRRNAGCRM